MIQNTGRPSVPSDDPSIWRGVDLIFRASSGTDPVGLEAADGVCNFHLGSDPSRWLDGVPTYASVIYRDIYPSIDLIFRSVGDGVKYDFVIHPGGDPRTIAIGLIGLGKVQQFERDYPGYEWVADTMSKDERDVLIGPLSGGQVRRLEENGITIYKHRAGNPVYKVPAVTVRLGEVLDMDASRYQYRYRIDAFEGWHLLVAENAIDRQPGYAKIYLVQGELEQVDAEQADAEEYEGVEPIEE